MCALHIYCNNNTLPSPLQCRSCPIPSMRWRPYDFRVYTRRQIRQRGPFPRCRSVRWRRTTQKRFYHNNNNNNTRYSIIRIYNSGALVRVRATFFFLLLCARAPCDELAYVPGVCVCARVCVCVCVCALSSRVFVAESSRRRRRAEDQQRRRHSSAVAVWCVWPERDIFGDKKS